MYLGRIVEILPAALLFEQARHPYTAALLSSIPSTDPAQRSHRRTIVGEVPSPIELPAGCAFHPRCPLADPRCVAERPQLGDDAAHRVACHHV